MRGNWRFRLVHLPKMSARQEPSRQSRIYLAMDTVTPTQCLLSSCCSSARILLGSSLPGGMGGSSAWWRPAAGGLDRSTGTKPAPVEHAADAAGARETMDVGTASCLYTSVLCNKR